MFLKNCCYMASWYHGLKFDPSGKCIQSPGQEVVPAKLGVKSYPVAQQAAAPVAVRKPHQIGLA